jgi:hypothetical protein
MTMMIYIQAPTTSTSASRLHCFGALITPGLELAFDERVNIELDGHTLTGEQTHRTVPVCGPAGTAIAERLRLHAQLHAEVVARALGLLNRDFNTPDNIGPRRAAAFAITTNAELDDAAADTHGFVDDLLRATARLGLRKIDL